MIDSDPEDPENPLELAVVSSNGTMVETGVDFTGAGVWEPTGDTTATLTFSVLEQDGSRIIIRTNIEVAADGQSFEAPYTFEVVEPDGQRTGEIGPGIAKGTRMNVEAPGTPVASFEELFGEPQGTPDATPTPATGITTEVLGQGQPSDVPGMKLWLVRITFEPGAVAASHSHPGSIVFTIQSGSITFMLEEGTVTLHRAGTIATPAAAEEISAGTEFTLNAGDTVFYESDAVFVVRVWQISGHDLEYRVHQDDRLLCREHLAGEHNMPYL